MRCPNCKVKILAISNYCSFCGFDLKAKQTKKRSKTIWFLAFFAVCLIFFIIVRHIKMTFSDNPLCLESQSVTPDIKEHEPNLDPQRIKTSEDRSRVQGPEFTMGTVTIRDISGEILSRIPTPLVSGNWIGLPIKICYGGYRWSFSKDPEKPIAVEWGVLQDHDQVGLWWIEGHPRAMGPELSAWRPEEPLYWFTITSDEQPISVTVDQSLEEQGYFSKIEMPGNPSDMGIFFQGNRIVGWSFGNMIAGGYLWTGMEGKDLHYNFRVEDFYRLTFAGGREEAFLMALSKKDSSDAELLTNLANGFRLDSKIPAPDVPSHLRRGPIVKRMKGLLTTLTAAGNYRAVADCIDGQILIQAQDPSLLEDVVTAVVKGYGYDQAVFLVEMVGRDISLDNGGEASRLNPLHLKLYHGWLTELMKHKDNSNAALVLNSALAFFPEDPEIHLWRVSLALEKNGWKEAERLLYERQYPLSLQDRARNLANEISELKSREGKIIIRFKPGSTYIPVQASLNNKTRQKFMVDTGATLTTIPYATARSLGFKFDRTYPTRRLHTVGGTITAPEIELSSIEIGQWIIHRVKALVVDLPQQPGIGLLGLNYLNRFRMNLNTDEGLLTLDPL